MKTPKEPKSDKEARLRERRISELERSRSVQTQARDLTNDIRRTYGNNFSMFGLSTARPIARPTTPAIVRTTLPNSRK